MFGCEREILPQVTYRRLTYPTDADARMEKSNTMRHARNHALTLPWPVCLISSGMPTCVMCPDADAPPDAEIKDLLFDIMKQDYGERGDYAIEMLDTAEGLLKQPEQNPRQAEAAAYCIRQAVVEISRGVKIDREWLRGMAYKAVEYKRHILHGPDQPKKEDYQRLFDVIDDMEGVLNRSTDHEAYLAATLRQRDRLDPIPGKQSILKTYQGLIKDVNDKFLHEVSKNRSDPGAVHRYYNQAIAILSKILLPSIRLREIVRLAMLDKPQEDDMSSLKRVMVNAYGFDYFARRMVSADWFGLMDSDMLKSPAGGPPWPLRSLAHHLKNAHADKFVRLVKKNSNSWAAEDAGLGELGFVWLKLGERWLPQLVETMRKSEQVRERCDREWAALSDTEPSDPRRAKVRRVTDSIRRLDDYAIRACLKAETPNDKFVELADRLMSLGAKLNGYHKTTTIPAKLVEMMDSPHSIQTIKILAKPLGTQQDLKHWTVFKPTSIARMEPDSPHQIDNMVGSLHSALRKACDLGTSTQELFEALDALPDAIKPRFVAWLYSRAGDIARSELEDFVVDSCGSRHPTDDDGLLLDRLEHDGGIGNDLAARIRSVIGEAPERTKMVGHPLQWDLNREKRWCIMWARMMRHRIRLPDGWGPCLEIVDRLGDAKRDAADGHTSDASQESTAPKEAGSEDPRAVAAEIATRSPEIRGLLGYANMLGAVPELETAVRRDASKWAENPVEIIRILRHPAYVAGYFASLAGSIEEIQPNANRLISAVRFVRTHPWDVASLDSPLFDYDMGWGGADGAGIDLISTMAEKNVPLGDGEMSDAWDLLCEAVADREEEHPEDAEENLIGAVDRKRHTRALSAVMRLIVYAADKKKTIPPKVPAVLTESAKLTGRVGEEHRVVLGTWLKLLHIALPDWFEQNEPLLLGSEVSGNLGQTTLDLHIQWGRLDGYVLEKYRGGVLDAVKRDVYGAIGCLLHGMFWGLDGYDPKSVAKSLVDIGPERVSEAGKQGARLLREGAGADYVRRGVDFWEAVLDSSPKPEALAGYGWWADVQEVSQDEWEELMQRTCEIAMGKPKRGEGEMGWVAMVAERIMSSQVTDAGLRILALLLRGNLSFELEQVAEHSVEALRKSKATLGGTNSWRRLREMLLEQGFHEADEI